MRRGSEGCPIEFIAFVALASVCWGAVRAYGETGDLPLPFQEQHPGLGWYISKNAMDSILVKPSDRYATRPCSMEVDFTTRRGSKEGFVMYPCVSSDEQGISVGSFEGIGFYYCGNGSNASMRFGLLVAPRPELGEKEPQRFTIDIELKFKRWRGKSLRWNDFPHALERRMLDSKDRLLAITFNLAPPPKVPNQCWIDGMVLLKKFRNLRDPDPEPTTFVTPRPFVAGPWAEAYGVLSRARQALQDKKPLNVLVLSGAEMYGYELWNLPGKATDYVFMNVFKREIEKEFEYKAINLYKLGTVADSISSEGEALFDLMRVQAEKLKTPPPQRVQDLYDSLGKKPIWMGDKLAPVSFDVLIVFFSYRDSRVSPTTYMNSLQAIMKIAGKSPSMEVVIVSPLPAASAQSDALARAVRRYCTENKMPYVNAYDGFLINGWPYLREMMIDERRMNWDGHDALGKMLFELFKKQRPMGQ